MTGGETPAAARSVILPRSAPRAIEWAAEEITSGSIVAIPTDTVYGIAASLAHPEALERIFAIKGRDRDRPMPLLVSSVEALSHVTTAVDRRVLLMLDDFWPGPLTMVIPADRALPDGVVAADGTVGVRIPNHPLAIEVIERAGGAVACTSANRSDEEPALSAADVEAALGGDIDLILDGGIAPGGRASTVVAIRDDDVVVLREGPIEGERIREAWETYRAAV